MRTRTLSVALLLLALAALAGCSIPVTLSDVSLLPGAVPLDASGLTQYTQDLSETENASRITGIQSFSLTFDCANASGQALTMDIWLSRNDSLTIANLPASGTAAAADTIRVWTGAIASGLNGQVQAPWGQITNRDQACGMLNPNTGRDAQGHKYVTVYVVTRPTGSGVIVGNMTADVTVGVSLLGASSRGTVEVVRVRFE